MSKNKLKICINIQKYEHGIYCPKNYLIKVYNENYTKNQLKTVQKIEHNLAYMDYAKIFCLQFYWLLV